LSPGDIEKIDRLFSMMAERGARINVTDKRVTDTTNWLLATIGVVFLAVGGWLISSVNRLSEGLATLVQQNAYSERIDDAQDKRLDIYEGRLRDIERKQ
jgi:hypothetical protein